MSDLALKPDIAELMVLVGSGPRRDIPAGLTDLNSVVNGAVRHLAA